MIEAKGSFQTILKDEFEKRCQRNSNYSLRAFARDIDLSPSRVSEIFSEKMGLSSANALKVAKNLAFNKHETEIFLALVDSECARGKFNKETAKSKLKKLRTAPVYTSLQGSHFKVISEWHHYAILELTYLKDFQSDYAWIAKRLGISKTAAELAIKRLADLELIEEKDGVFKAVDDFTASPNEIPSESLKKHHEQILDKAKASVYGQSIEQRDLSAITLAVDKNKIPEAKALIKKFRREFNQLMNDSTEKDRVYCLAVQFFGLDQE